MSRDWTDVTITSHELGQLHHEIEYLKKELAAMKKDLEWALWAVDVWVPGRGGHIHTKAEELRKKWNLEE